MTASDTRAPTSREIKKAERRSELLEAAARLFADRGFAGVRLEDLGAAVGVSGPAVYRHFPNKEAVLIELLVDISQYLLAGGRRVASDDREPAEVLESLVEFHLDFAIESPALIKIQDRDLQSLPESAHRRVRRMQREYVEIWVSVLRRLNPTIEEADARTIAHAAFGLMNSTPFSAKKAVSRRTRTLLRDMMISALGLPSRA
ncbi:MAG: TetR/AcrR family transcriptional regulator [Rhodococcus sp. (in: high G+C Gram-positive bacteria)]